MRSMASIHLKPEPRTMVAAAAAPTRWAGPKQCIGARQNVLTATLVSQTIKTHGDHMIHTTTTTTTTQLHHRVVSSWNALMK